MKKGKIKRRRIEDLDGEPSGPVKLKVRLVHIDKKTMRWELFFLEEDESLRGTFSRIGGAYRVSVNCENGPWERYSYVSNLIQFCIFQALKKDDEDINFVWEKDHYITYPPKLFVALNINHTCPTCKSNFHIAEVDIDDSGKCHFCRGEKKRPVYSTWNEADQARAEKEAEKPRKPGVYGSQTSSSRGVDLNEDFRHMDIDSWEDYLGSL